MRTALVLTEDSMWHLRTERQERERRAFATERVCDVVAMGLIEGGEHAVRRLLEPALGYDAVRVARERTFPGYTFIRDFLISEMDADPIIAARVAARQTVFHNRLTARTERDYFTPSRVRGWL